MGNLSNKIALGSVQFGMDYGISNSEGRTSEIEVQKILDIASENGIKFIDTAQAYGDAESIIGRHHKNRFKIITKLDANKLNSYSVADLIRQSKDKLCVKTIYGVLFHSAQNALKNPSAYKELIKIRDTGIVQKIGYSIYKTEELNQLIDKYGKPDLVQIPFSHLDRRFEEIALQLHSSGVEVHSRSTFLQGLYFINYADLTSFFNPIKDYLFKLQESFENIAQLAYFLLNYVISKSFIDKVIIGVNNSEQLFNNLKEITTKLPEFQFDISHVPEDILIPYKWPKN